MRIIDQEIWDAVKARQQSFAYETSEPGECAERTAASKALVRRPREVRLLWWRLHDDLEGSAQLRDVAEQRHLRQPLDRLNIRRDALEASVLSGLRTHLMERELSKEFCDEFTREVNRLRIERGAQPCEMGFRASNANSESCWLQLRLAVWSKPSSKI